MTYHFDIEKCKVCPLKNGCYKPESKSRTYSVPIKTDEHQEQEIFQQSEYFREKSRHRFKIEAKNSELKNVHGYDRANSYGLESMKMQGALAIFVVNLKRILKFWKQDTNPRNILVKTNNRLQFSISNAMFVIN